jgi:phosphoribosyl-AMP cyclohydrolase / phosphoribosyl-ATP pyrophosphohydrolase
MNDPAAKTRIDLEVVDFSKAGGIVPLVAQDAGTGAVLMVGFCNREALAATIATGEVTFYSRTKGRLWKKGETSGNVLDVRELRLDCDRDTVLAMVKPRGPVCHTGEQTCFGPDALTKEDPIRMLERVVSERKTAGSAASYTRKLFDNRNLRLKKLGEEAAELIVALADGRDRRHIAEEGADLLYHLVVALAAADVELDDVRRVLAERAEK